MNSGKISEENFYTKYITSNENYMSKIKFMLTTIISNLNSNSIYKLSLINLQNFNIQNLFDELDTCQKGYLNSVDIIYFLKKFSLNFSEQLIRRFIQHYDKKTPYKIYFDDFKALITPKKNFKKENENNNDIKGNKDELFLKILKNEFKLIVEYNEMIADIKKCENFITYEAFITISEEEKNIDKEKLKKFLGNEYNDEDAKTLLYYLDMDNDGFLTYDEFEDFFASMPVSQDDINYMMKNENLVIKINNIEKKEIKKDFGNINEKSEEINNKIVNINNVKNVKNIKNIKKEVVEVVYEQKISNIKEIKTSEIKHENNNINIKNNNINEENNNIFINNIEEMPRNTNKILKKINYNNKNLLKNNKDIIEYETYLKNRYSTTDENVDNNIIKYNNNKNININIKEINNKEEKIENNRIIYPKNENNSNNNQKINKKEIIIQKKLVIENNDNNNINNNEIYYNIEKNEENLNNQKKEIIINNHEEEHIMNINNENNKIDNSNNDINSNLINNKEINENEIMQNNNNDYNNNLFSSNNFSGNLSSTDFNKSENFINENYINNNNNNLQKNNEIEYQIEYSKSNNDNNIHRDIKNKYNIESENLQYIQNNYKIKNNKELKEEELYIQKNQNIELKKEFHKNMNLNKIETNNSLNHNSENSQSQSQSNHLNVNGSLFTCGGNLDQEKASLKQGTQDIEIEENKFKISSNNSNKDIATQINKEDKLEQPFNNINKNLNNVFSKEIISNNNNIKNSEFYNSNNKYFYYQDKIQNEEDKKIIYDKKNKYLNNQKINYKSKENYNPNYYINKDNIIKKEEKNINIIKNLNNNKIFKEQIHEEREDYTDDFSSKQYKYINEKYIIENNNLKKNLLLTNNTNKNNSTKINIFSNEKLTPITPKSDSSDNDNTQNNEGTLLKTIKLININSNEYNFNSKSSINIFLDYIDFILKSENNCFILKENLALREDITFKELFCLFDYHKNKNITVHEFKKVCKNSMGLYPTSDQVTLIFNRYDVNKDEKLDLKEFLNMISPIKKEYLSILFGDKKLQKNFKNELSEKSKKIIETLTKTIILNETNYYEIREKMRINNFNKNEVWKILMQFSKSKNKNYLNKKNFDRFLKSYSYNLTSYEIDIIFNKFDFDRDSHINLDDFNHEFNI